MIASARDLRKATRLRRLPDLFEVRLDALHPLSFEMEQSIRKLKRPLIVTARHPAEGGRGDLSAAQRRRLLLQFLPEAEYVDVELRSAKALRSVLAVATERKTTRILSVHELRRTPSLRELDRLARRAQELSADVLKIVTRTETSEELIRLFDFFESWKTRMALSVMGLGKFGRESRVAFLRRGSVLHYVHLGKAGMDGQLSLVEARRQLETVR
ncbi:MAG TPA: type I 3-dehydroquinate dehydratase [Chthoniobacterales bacterium]|nr:type I 3-dehydroquinate dehydratase [Chthoniobacterales bacterium]